MRNVLLIASIALAATGLAGCGSEAKPAADSSAPCKADDFKVTGDFGKAPKVEIPACKPGAELAPTRADTVKRTTRLELARGRGRARNGRKARSIMFPSSLDADRPEVMRPVSRSGVARHS